MPTFFFTVLVKLCKSLRCLVNIILQSLKSVRLFATIFSLILLLHGWKQKLEFSRLHIHHRMAISFPLYLTRQPRHSLADIEPSFNFVSKGVCRCTVCVRVLPCALRYITHQSTWPYFPAPGFSAWPASVKDLPLDTDVRLSFGCQDASVYKWLCSAEKLLRHPRSHTAVLQASVNMCGECWCSGQSMLWERTQEICRSSFIFSYLFKHFTAFY